MPDDLLEALRASPDDDRVGLCVPTRGPAYAAALEYADPMSRGMLERVDGRSSLALIAAGLGLSRVLAAGILATLTQARAVVLVEGSRRSAAGVAQLVVIERGDLGLEPALPILLRRAQAEEPCVVRLSSAGRLVDVRLEGGEPVGVRSGDQDQDYERVIAALPEGHAFLARLRATPPLPGEAAEDRLVRAGILKPEAVERTRVWVAGKVLTETFYWTSGSYEAGMTDEPFAKSGLRFETLLFQMFDGAKPGPGDEASVQARSRAYIEARGPLDLVGRRLRKWPKYARLIELANIPGRQVRELLKTTTLDKGDFAAVLLMLDRLRLIELLEAPRERTHVPMRDSVAAAARRRDSVVPAPAQQARDSAPPLRPAPSRGSMPKEAPPPRRSSAVPRPSSAGTSPGPGKGTSEAPPPGPKPPRGSVPGGR